VISLERLKFFDDWMSQNPIGLLRSPPASGKTTLSTKLESFLRARGRNVINISLLRISTAEINSHHGFNAYWTRNCAKSWEACMNGNRQLDIIIDEAQVLYPQEPPFFWNDLKRLNQQITLDLTRGGHPRIRVLLLSMYGEPSGQDIKTPIDFQDSLGIKNLRFTEREYHQLVKNFTLAPKSREVDFTISIQVAETVYRITGGHCGLVRKVLKDIREQYRNNVRTDSALLLFLTSSGFREHLRNTRAFSWLKKWRPTDNESQLLRKAFMGCDSNSEFSVDSDNPWELDILDKYLHSGLLVKNDSNFQFTAPLMRITLGHFLFRAKIIQETDTRESNSFEEFLFRSIERMRPSVLCKSLSRSHNGSLLERAWQMEWYHSATTAVPSNTSISPDVGPVFGSAGFLDFYVNRDLNWGIELVREGTRARAHLDRFLQGSYRDIPLKEWIILDFRSDAREIMEPHQHFWYICYPDNPCDFSRVKIRRLNHEDKEIQLIGGDLG
jgi:hypothetical protein